MRLAITRDVSPAIGKCELTHLKRQPIDVDLARAQHAEYERALVALGCAVHRLPAAADLPDSVFVEDCAIVLDEIAIITRPGAASRRPETADVEQALTSFRPIARIGAPETLDGGDVLRAGRTLFVGLSSRTTSGAIGQLRALVAPFGYSVVGVEVRGCLHLKSAVTEVAGDTLLVNRAWIPGDCFQRFDCIEVDRDEPGAANAVRVGAALVYPSGFPRTCERLRSSGFEVRLVDVSELAKAEGAVTCCSLLVET